MGRFLANTQTYQAATASSFSCFLAVIFVVGGGRWCAYIQIYNWKNPSHNSGVCCALSVYHWGGYVYTWLYTERIPAHNLVNKKVKIKIKCAVSSRDAIIIINIIIIIIVLILMIGAFISIFPNWLKTPQSWKLWSLLPMGAT